MLSVDEGMLISAFRKVVEDFYSGRLGFSIEKDHRGAWLISCQRLPGRKEHVQSS
jgi:hypothetical protein